MLYSLGSAGSALRGGEEDAAGPSDLEPAHRVSSRNCRLLLKTSDFQNSSDFLSSETF